MDINDYVSKFNLVKLSVIVKKLNNYKLPQFIGSTLRGSFGHALKKIFCLLPTPNNKFDCNICSSNQICNYSYVFESIIPFNSEVMKKYTNAPPPFIINQPLTMETRDYIEFTLILIGLKSCLLLPYYIYAFDIMGMDGIGKNKGQFIVESVYSVDKTEKKLKFLMACPENSYLNQ